MPNCQFRTGKVFRCLQFSLHTGNIPRPTVDSWAVLSLIHTMLFSYICSILLLLLLLLVVIVNLLLCLIYKLDFIIFMYVWKKTWYIQGLVLTVISGIHWVSWNTSPADKGGLYLKAILDTANNKRISSHQW